MQVIWVCVGGNGNKKVFFGLFWGLNTRTKHIEKEVVEGGGEGLDGGEGGPGSVVAALWGLAGYRVRWGWVRDRGSMRGWEGKVVQRATGFGKGLAGGGGSAGCGVRRGVGWRRWSAFGLGYGDRLRV